MAFSFGHKQHAFPPFPQEAFNRLDKDTLRLVPQEVAGELQAFVFENNEGTAKVAAVNPENPLLRRYMKERLGERIQWFLATKQDVTSFLRHHVRDFTDEIEKLNSSRVDAGGNITKLVDTILEYAFQEKASDVHVEPLRDKTVIRFRVDGTLHPVASLRRNTHAAIVSRFKILGGLKIDEYRRPQDGRIDPEHMPDV